MGTCQGGFDNQTATCMKACGCFSFVWYILHRCFALQTLSLKSVTHIWYFNFAAPALTSDDYRMRSMVKLDGTAFNIADRAYNASLALLNEFRNNLTVHDAGNAIISAICFRIILFVPFLLTINPPTLQSRGRVPIFLKGQKRLFTLRYVFYLERSVFFNCIFALS